MFIQAEIWTIAKTDQGLAVLLRPVDSHVTVPIFIGPNEAHSILLGMASASLPRPNCHDLMISLLGSLQYRLTRIEITDIREGIFFAVLHLQSGENEVLQDSRPSDAIALAVREKCPLFISDAVIAEAGIDLDILIQGDDPPGETFSEGQLEQLKEALEKAVSEENYEEAARLRDLLKSLDESSPRFDEEG